MKRFSAVSLVVLFSMSTSAQEKPSVSGKQDPPSAGAAAAAAEEVRIRALEEQVRTLAEAFISFGEEGVNVEEGYVTFTSLPAGLLLKVGKMRAEFGKVNTIHNHALSFIDRPLVTNSLVGGEDGIDDAGISLSRFLPAPKNWFLQGTAQVFRGDSSDVFTANRRQDASVVGHLRLYRDLGESTNIDLGASYARC